ncbi:pol [Symbiodinium sp. CCMP2592]|nr:pol [Symbiodinium sp. CCMP2592]
MMLICSAFCSATVMISLRRSWTPCRLRDLGQRKLKLQEDIDLAKANLRALLTKMQDLQTSIQEAQTEVNKATQEYETKVLTQCTEEANHGVESVLQALGIQEEALTEAQKRSLEALKRENADEAKRRKTQQQEQFPPGLTPQLRSAAPATEANKEAEDAKGPPSQPIKERSRFCVTWKFRSLAQALTRFQGEQGSGRPGWGSMLNLSAYKALHPAWNQVSLVPSRAFHAESVALAKAGYHVHGQHARHVHTFQDPDTGSTFDGRANTLVLSNMYAVIASLKRAAELDYALVHPRLASHLSLELAWDDLQPNLRAITDSFDPILDDQRNLQPPVISPQRVTLLEIEACDPVSLAFAEFSATAEASGLLGKTTGMGVNLPTVRQPAVSQPPNNYQWFGYEHSVWSQLAGRFKAGGPQNEILSLLSKLGPEHQQWADEARDTASNHRGVAALRSHAEAQAKLAKTAQHGEQAESYQQWLFGALSAGMGPVYRALKSHEQTLARPFRDQSALARAYCRMEFWSRIWDASIVPPQVHLSERLALRAEALQQAQDLSPLSWEQVKTACLATGNKKGGLDGWSYKALRKLPDFCYRQLAGLFRLVETDLNLPLQMLTVQVALLAKTPEKERPISLTSVLWRVYSKLRRPLLESWLREYAAFAPFDSATPGHTSLDPALSRLIKAEDHKFRKVTFITLFVDLEGFYDGVDFSPLISQGKALSFPPLLLELSLQLYNGPRCLHGEGVSTVALWPKRGILQGCPYAPTVAKLTTHAPLQGISKHRGVSHADLWLDDISVDVSHADPEVAASLALSASRKLEDLLSVEKLRINKTKTKFVVNSAKAAKALNSMRVEGDPQVADLVRDLGIDSAGAKRRRVRNALKRFKIGRARNQKLHQLGTGGKAHRLYATSILTAEIYGCQGQGLSPKRLKVVRASISRHVGRSKWGSVDVSLDCMSFRCQDPLLTVVLAQADALYKMFGPSTAQGWVILARTWKVAWTRQEAAVHGWKCVAGPVAAMVQYCIDLRINVSDPLRWVHSSGVLQLDVANPGLFLSVRRFLTQVVALERASRFGAVPTAQGAQKGVDWSVHRKLLKVSKPSSPRSAFHAVWQGRTLHSGHGTKGLDDSTGLSLSLGNQGPGEKRKEVSPVRERTSEVDSAPPSWRPFDYAPVPRDQTLRVVGLGPAQPNQKRPTTLWHYMPKELLFIFDLGGDCQRKATWSPRLGKGKDRLVYVDPVSPDHVLKMAYPDGHGQEVAISSRFPALFPRVEDMGYVHIKLNWLDSVDHCRLHCLRSQRVTPLMEYLGGAPASLDLIYTLFYLDLGSYNWAVFPRRDSEAPYVCFVDAADWVHAQPESVEALQQLTNNASPTYVMESLRTLISPEYQVPLKSRGLWTF